MAAGLGLLGGVEGQELGALALGSGGKLERGLRQRCPRDAELIHFAGEPLAQQRGAGGSAKRARDLARRLAVAIQRRLRSIIDQRSEERREGKEWGGTCRSWGSPYN